MRSLASRVKRPEREQIIQNVPLRRYADAASRFVWSNPRALNASTWDSAHSHNAVSATLGEIRDQGVPLGVSNLKVEG